jgi:hypothetical protein
MTRTRHLIAAIMCAVVGLAAGWAVHGGNDRGSTADTGPTSKSARRSGTDLRPAPPAGIAGRIGRVAGLEDTGARMKAAYAMAMSVPLDRIQEWLNGDYFDTPDSRIDGFFYQVLYDRWLDADPEAFLTHCLHKNYDSVLTYRYMKEWARRDPTAARDFMMNLTDRKDLDQVAGLVLGEMAKADPEGAIALIRELSRTRGLETYRYSDALTTLAEQDPDGLLQASADWPPSLAQRVLNKVCASKLQEDFLGAVDWMRDHPDQQGQHLFRQSISNNRKLVPEFFRLAKHLPEGWAKDVIQRDTWSIADADPDACLALIPEDLGMEEKDLFSLRRNALDQIADKDWDKGAAMLQGDSRLSDSERKTLAKELASELAVSNLQKAKTWSATLADPALREAAEKAIASREKYGSSSRMLTPDSLIANALKDNGGSSAHGAQYWTGRESTQAVDAFLELPAADRTKAAKHLLNSRSNLPFDLQATLLSHQLSLPAPPESAKPDPNRDPFAQDTAQHISGLARQWAAWEPAAAARWVQSLPPGPQRDDASKRILATWRAQNPAEADRWLHRLPGDSGWETIRNKEAEAHP